MRRYHFVTRIDLTAPFDAVWDALQATEDWPTWWRWVEDVEVLDPGDDAGLGRRVRNRVRAPMGYRLAYDGTVTDIRRHRDGPSQSGTVALVVTGHLAGQGHFRLTGDEDATSIVFTWDVAATRWWMRLLAPLAAPAFSWNHHRLMDDFAAGLATTTGATLTAAEHRLVGRPEMSA